jgi:hypothetical protein
MVEEPWPGVYYVVGDIIPIQIVESKRLVAEENLWLRALGNRLDRGSALKVLEGTAQREDDGDLRAYLYALMRVNQEIMKEVLKMSNAGELTYEELLREVGFIDRWEARGKEEKALEIAKNLLAEGFSVEQTARLAELDLEKVRSLA